MTTALRMNRATPTDARWQAVMARDRASDGAFVYAVRSTGIYCRPSCPSRRPRRNTGLGPPQPKQHGQADRSGEQGQLHDGADGEPVVPKPNVAGPWGGAGGLARGGV